MDISVVIGVHGDLRLKNCLDSIDEDVEVIISLNAPTDPLMNLVNNLLQQKKEHGAYEKLSFSLCTIDYPSIAGAYNNGILHASNQKVLLMDSDCLFTKGCIRIMDTYLNQYRIVKGNLVFSHYGFLTAIVAKAREFHATDQVKAYKPPLLFKKDIIHTIGGYYFHPSLCWLEDSEFDFRIQKAGLAIAYDACAVVIHAPLTPARDLRSAFWYGVGKQIGVRLGIHSRPTGAIASIKKYIFEGCRRKGFLTGCYLYIWKLTLLLGYHSQRIFHLRSEK
ncbi:MAG TPA: glycosyltransferase [Ktedonobacteraceae bacterium]|jgi:glycosyltransferase involved in cell wall biosynthesis